MEFRDLVNKVRVSGGSFSDYFWKGYLYIGKWLEDRFVFPRYLDDNIKDRSYLFIKDEVWNEFLDIYRGSVKDIYSFNDYLVSGINMIKGVFRDSGQLDILLKVIGFNIISVFLVSERSLSNTGYMIKNGISIEGLPFMGLDVSIYRLANDILDWISKYKFYSKRRLLRVGALIFKYFSCDFTCNFVFS